jgi:hypothetical protein
MDYFWPNGFLFTDPSSVKECAVHFERQESKNGEGTSFIAEKSSTLGDLGQ